MDTPPKKKEKQKNQKKQKTQFLGGLGLGVGGVSNEYVRIVFLVLLFFLVLCILSEDNS